MTRPQTKARLVSLDEIRVSKDEFSQAQLKQISVITHRGEAWSKKNDCLICGNQKSKFCKSHTIPQFILKNIAKNGYVYSPSVFSGAKESDARKGLRAVNTFRAICRDCDSGYFRAYEDPGSWASPVTEEMLSQIALKNYLNRAANRYRTQGLAKSTSEHFGVPIHVDSKKGEIHQLDIADFERQLEYSKRAVNKQWNDSYYSQLLITLEYIVPVAFQGAIAMSVGFDQGRINDLQNFSSKYLVQELHICIFPLETKTLVFCFTRKDENRHRSFFRKLRTLNEEEQLKVINYIVLAYSDAVYFSPMLDCEKFSDQTLKEVVSQTMTFEIQSNCPSIRKGSLEDLVLARFSCNNAFSTTNLLSREYAIR